MLKLSCLLSIGPLEVDAVHSVEVDRSWKTLTDTAVIQLPRKVQVLGHKAKALKDFLKVGDAVSISLGYGQDMFKVFDGFISHLDPTVPVVIKCEDAMWKLKQSQFSGAWINASLKDVLNTIAPDLEHDAVDATLGKFQFNASAAKVLNTIKGKYGLPSFIRNGKLTTGLQYDPDYAVSDVFDFEQNIHPNGNDLEFWNKENVRLKVKAVSIGKDNKKTTIELGDSDGEQRTIHFYSLSEQELERAAERELLRLKYDGFRGGFVTFGLPGKRPGDIAVLSDPTFPERSGKYWIDEVKTTFSGSGFKQKIKLGPVVN